MSDITATVVSQPITATVNASGGISANVGSSSVSVSASGGIGPQGPQGVQGAQGLSGSALAAASDVQLSNVADGDLLRYDSGRWRNHAEGDLILDGQNF